MSTDIEIMAKRFGDTMRDPTISCGVCDPSNAANRLVWQRYDTILIVATVDTVNNNLTIAPQTIRSFTTGQGEQMQGAPAGALKGLADTNLDPGGSPADSPCIFTAYDVNFEVESIVAIDAAGVESYPVATNYDGAYNREALAAISNNFAFTMVEPNGCIDNGAALSMFPSDGSSKSTGDQYRSGLLGLTRGLRFSVCFPGQNAKRPYISIASTRSVVINGNGANPFAAATGTQVIGIKVRVVITGSLDAPV